MDGSPPTVRVSGRNTPLDYVFLTRPVLMPPVWTIALLGSAQSWDPGRPLSEWTFLVVQLWCLFGAVYVLNQIADIESDRINRKLFFLPEGIISQRAARVFTITLNVIAVLLGALFGVEYLGLTIVIILLGFVYSLGHRPWKNKPVLGFLANVIAHGLIVFAMGAAFAGAYNPHIWIHATAYACAVGAVYLATTVADVPGDRASGKRTIAVAIGGRGHVDCVSVCSDSDGVGHCHAGPRLSRGINPLTSRVCLGRRHRSTRACADSGQSRSCYTYFRGCHLFPCLPYTSGDRFFRYSSVFSLAL